MIFKYFWCLKAAAGSHQATTEEQNTAAEGKREQYPSRRPSSFPVSVVTGVPRAGAGVSGSPQRRALARQSSSGLSCHTLNPPALAIVRNMPGSSQIIRSGRSPAVSPCGTPHTLRPPPLTRTPLLALHLPTCSWLQQGLLLPLTAFTKAAFPHAFAELRWQAPGFPHKEPHRGGGRRARRRMPAVPSAPRAAPPAPWPSRHGGGCPAPSPSAREKPQDDALPPPLGASHSSSGFLRRPEADTFRGYLHVTQHRNHSACSLLLQLSALSHGNYSCTSRLQRRTRRLSSPQSLGRSRLPACPAETPALPPQPGSRPPGCAAWCLPSLENRRCCFVPHRRARTLGLGDSLPHSSTFLWFNLTYENSVFSPKPLVDWC